MEHLGLLFISASGHTVSLSHNQIFSICIFSFPSIFLFSRYTHFSFSFSPIAHIQFLSQTDPHKDTEWEVIPILEAVSFQMYIYKYEVTDVYVKTIAEKYIHTLIHVSFSLSNSQIHSNLGTYHVLSLKNLHYRGTYQVLIFLKLLH